MIHVYTIRVSYISFYEMMHVLYASSTLTGDPHPSNPSEKMAEHEHFLLDLLKKIGQLHLNPAFFFNPQNQTMVSVNSKKPSRDASLGPQVK